MSIEVEGVTKLYGQQKALNNISFKVDKPEIVGFLGPNGAGKSTMMKILTTFLNASQGIAKVNGFDVVKNTNAVQQSVGYLPEHNPLYLEQYVKEYLTFNASIYKIDKAIENFQMNVAVAQFYEVYNHFNEYLKLEINNKVLLESLVKIMKLMVPFTPHLASECLTILKCKETNIWPEINKSILNKAKMNVVIQVNGKTRDVINVNKNLNEKDLDKLIKSISKAKKYIVDKKIIKTIYIKNKIINYIVEKNENN